MTIENLAHTDTKYHMRLNATFIRSEDEIIAGMISSSSSTEDAVQILGSLLPIWEESWVTTLNFVQISKSLRDTVTSGAVLAYYRS